LRKGLFSLFSFPLLLLLVLFFEDLFFFTLSSRVKQAEIYTLFLDIPLDFRFGFPCDGVGRFRLFPCA